MKIPATFDLMGFTFTVEHVPAAHINMRAGGAEVWGLFIPGEQKILLRQQEKGMSKQQVEQTFCHELFHAMFWCSTYAELGDDEKLVDHMGRLFQQYHKTAH